MCQVEVEECFGHIYWSTLRAHVTFYYTVYIFNINKVKGIKFSATLYLIYILCVGSFGLQCTQKDKKLKNKRC